MNKIKSLFFKINATDLVVIIFCAFLTLLNVAYCNKIETWYLNVLMNFAITAYIIFVSYFDEKKKRHYLETVALLVFCSTNIPAFQRIVFNGGPNSRDYLR